MNLNDENYPSFLYSHNSIQLSLSKHAIERMGGNVYIKTVKKSPGTSLNILLTLSCIQVLTKLQGSKKTKDLMALRSGKGLNYHFIQQSEN